MCGIVGYTNRDSQYLHHMMEAIHHRGPDETGVHHSDAHKVFIGMQRLSILDIEGGKQPFKSKNGDVSLLYNGEIYNHLDVRKELVKDGVKFSSNTDTETILYAYLKWGTDAWKRLNGMFAFAIHDQRQGQQKIIIVRDRFGIKPLYYSHDHKKLSFASELKALLVLPDLDQDICSSSLHHYLMHRYIPGDGTVFRGIKRLRPGYQMIFDVETGHLEQKQWWQKPAYTSVNNDMSLKEATDLYGEALNKSVQRHMLSDVSLGTYLSAGVDSTVIAALMAQNSAQPINTFSIGFPGFEGNELKEAEDTSAYLGSQHHSLMCGYDELENLPYIVKALDEPFGDAIVLPMYALARETRKDVKVVLSGEGADETLGGYLFTRKILLLNKVKKYIPKSSWFFLSKIFQMVPLFVLEKLFDYPDSLGTAGKTKLRRFLEIVGRKDLKSLNDLLITIFDEQDVQNLTVFKNSIDTTSNLDESLTALQNLSNHYLDDWLPNEILAKYDRMTMAHSLEGRVPYVDDQVLSALETIPDRYKINGDKNKIVLREYAKSILPAHLLERPKAAFYTPLKSYNETDIFKNYVKNYLNPERLQKRGIIQSDSIGRLLSQDKRAGFLPLKQVFSILMLEMWFEEFKPDYTYERH